MADDILKNIPLPADLPENWTSGQTIAPTGEEVGLDNQYGYNYLMMQVNNAQKALKALAAQREEDLARVKYWFSDDPTSPASFIGGTWEQIKDRFILAAGDTYVAGSTGGEATHTLTKEEMPEYNPKITVKSDVNASYNRHAVASIEWTDLWSAYEYCVSGFGGGKQHNNMPPYLTAYIWRRIA